MKAEKHFHSTTLQAAQIAKDAEVKELVIGHFSARYTDENELLKEAKSIFSNTLLADEGKVFEMIPVPICLSWK